MYDSIDQVVAYGFYGMYVFYHIRNFNKNHNVPVCINTFKSNSLHIALRLKPIIVIFKPHSLTVTMVTKCTYYY